MRGVRYICEQINYCSPIGPNVNKLLNHSDFRLTQTAVIVLLWLITSMIGAAHSPDSWDLSVTLKRNAHRWLHNLFPFGSPLCVECEAYSERDGRSEPENYSWSSLTLYVSLGHSLPARSQSQLMVSQHWLAALFFIYIYILHTHNTVYEYASLGTSISKRMYCL